MLNRIRAQLRMRSHRNQTLQADWDADGADAFEFVVLDLLPAPTEVGAYDPTDDLEVLLELWREKLGLPERTTY
ncbi:MAG: hypothetical protein OEO79_05400 [Gemmatimonadota bacterium]|nr:hypothetical protein [Gemmatimonadota bacterium]